MLALTAEGEVFAWGSAAHGALGIAPREVLLARLPVDDEGMSFQPRPTLVERLRGRPVRCVAAAEQHSLATTVPPPLPPTPPCRRATARLCGPMPARATTTTR